MDSASLRDERDSLRRALELAEGRSQGMEPVQPASPDLGNEYAPFVDTFQKA